MLELHGSGCGHARSARLGRHLLYLTVLSLLTAGDLTEPRPLSAAQLVLGADTARAPQTLHFRDALPFQVQYLGRVAEMARERKSAAAAEAAARPSATASTYATRYGITRELAQKILDVATAEGVDPELAFRLIRVESVFKPNARGRAGALGLTQLMPSTARSIDRSVNTEAEILDPQNNLRLGFRYLREMIVRYKGDVRLGVLAYNRGEVAVDRALRRGQNPENGYSHKVLGTRSSNPYRGKGLLKR
jgi:soluble lytic murein transglycosylase-like protein